MPRGVAYAADLLMESAKKVEKEQTQTTARRNQNKASERRWGETVDALLVSRHSHSGYLPTTLHHPSLPTINCDWLNLARVSHVAKKGERSGTNSHF